MGLSTFSQALSAYSSENFLTGLSSVFPAPTVRSSGVAARSLSLSLSLADISRENPATQNLNDRSLPQLSLRHMLSMQKFTTHMYQRQELFPSSTTSITKTYHPTTTYPWVPDWNRYVIFIFPFSRGQSATENGAGGRNDNSMCL